MEATGQSRDPVKLVVKAPNQQFEDQTVECELQWSVKRLKEHLFEVYPCKPTPADQKLIYSGQLLKDQVILKDILRHYDDPQPQYHILHLVYAPKNQQHPLLNPLKNQNAPGIGSDGLRQRNVSTTNSTPNIQSQTATNLPQNLTNNVAAASLNCPASGPADNRANNLPGFGYPQQQNQYLMAQQMAMQSWMQQAYIQYMNQYMNLLSEGMRPEAVFMQHQAQPQMPYMPQNVPFSQPTFGSSMPNANLPSQSAVAADAQAAGVGETAVNAPGVAAAQQPAQAQNQQPQPRFPNLVEDNPEENRDWLDTVYSLIRIMVLLTLVYFYSSALRCAVVGILLFAIYLYHRGVFRRPVQEANNNNVAAAVENIQQQRQQQHNQDANRAADVDNNGEQDPNAPAEGVNREGGEVASTASTPEAPESNGTSVIAFVRTFVVSFFVSLLPETPAL